jgi:hypothetical protein
MHWHTFEDGAELNNKVVLHNVHTEDELQVRQPGIRDEQVAHKLLLIP